MTYRFKSRHGLLLSGSVLALALGGCLSSGSDDSGGPGDAGEVDETHAVTAEVEGLARDRVRLEFNGQSFEAEADGEWELDDSAEQGSEFTLEILDHPTGPAQFCEPSDTSGEIEGDLHITINCVTPLRVVGQVADSVGPDERLVILSDGSTSWETETDADGSFSLEFDLDYPWAVMSLELEGSPDHLRSELGSLIGLYDERGVPAEDHRNMISESVTGRVKLNHLNTVVAGYMSWLNDHEPFEDHEDLRAASRNILTEEAANVAAAFYEVTQGERDMPSHAEGYYAAAQQFPQTLEWEEGQDSNAMPVPETAAAGVAPTAGEPVTGSMRPQSDDALAAVIDEASVEAASFDEVPSQFFMVSGFEWGRDPFAGGVDLVGPSAWFRDRVGTVGPGPHTVSDGDLYIDMGGVDEPYAAYPRNNYCENEDGYVIDCRVEEYIDQLVVRQVLDGFGSEMVLSERHMTREFHPIDEGADEPVDPNESWQDDHFVALLTPGQNEAMDADLLPGTLTLPFPGEDLIEAENAAGSADLIVDVHDGGTGELQHKDLSFAWEVESDGELRVRDNDYALDYNFWLLSGDPDGMGQMLVVPQHDNQISIHSSIAMREDEDLFFQQSDLEGQWVQWKGADLNFSDDWILDYDGSASTAYLGFDGEEGDHPWYFESQGDAANPHFALARLFSSGGDYESISSLERPDVEDVDQGQMFDRRDIYPVRVTDDRFYFIQLRRWWMASMDGGDPTWFPMHYAWTPRYYERVGDHEQ